MNDFIILGIVKTLNGGIFEYERVTAAGWQIYVNDPQYLKSRPYRLIWCLHPDEGDLGVINAFRR